ncbi:hypothetical protein JMN32_00020 [Fulvivirga sp. 29W222]|uniref:Uncharacterized protein n=1 Tax=Fulvivirga marina TaxID=2494733 RepID=A0A937FUG8_9BACT|nr:hypothetical protein [Fulvivirga marina]MBL6444672.1 hypothetical protein [Fulvivirga marina]
MQQKTTVRPIGRIDYIVRGNTPGVLRLIRNYGYAVPKRPEHLAGVVRQVIREHGRPAVRKLLRYHPDRKLLLGIAGTSEDHYCSYCSSTSEDSYCGCVHSNYDTPETKDSLSDKIRDMSADELEKFYRQLLSQSNANPTDKTLADELQTVWAELRTKLSAKSNDIPESRTDKENKNDGINRRELLLIFGLALTAGVLVGVSLKAGHG